MPLTGERAQPDYLLSISDAKSLCRLHHDDNSSLNQYNQNNYWEVSL